MVAASLMRKMSLKHLWHLLCLSLQCCKHPAADSMLAVWHAAAMVQAYC
jgi:hypothetical protein